MATTIATLSKVNMSCSMVSSISLVLPLEISLGSKKIQDFQVYWELQIVCIVILHSDCSTGGKGIQFIIKG